MKSKNYLSYLTCCAVLFVLISDFEEVKIKE